MQASSSGSEDREDGRKPTRMSNVKLSVSDLAPDDFKKVWLSLKAVHDKEVHRLQVKLSNMRKARLTEGRRCGGPVPKDNKPLTQPPEASSSKVCERCLVNETYGDVLQQEFSNMQQKNLVQIAELTVENNKLKEENKMLLERLKAPPPPPPPPRVQLNFSDSDYEDFVKGTQMKIKRMYTVKEPTQAVQIQSPPRYVTKPHDEQKKSLCTLKAEPPPPDKSIPQNNQEILVVSETSFVDSSCAEDQCTHEANILLSCTACSLKATLDTSKKDDSNNFSERPEVKPITSTQKCGKNIFSWSFSSISSGEPVIVSETSEESIPCKPSSALASLEKKKEQSSTQVIPVDYSSKYNQKRKSHSGSSHNDGISLTSDHIPLLSVGEISLKNTCESKSIRHLVKRSKSDSERVLSEIVLKRKSK